MKVFYVKNKNKTSSLKKGDSVNILNGTYKNKNAIVTSIYRKKGYVLLDIVLKNSKQQDRDLKIYYSNLEKI